MIGFAIVERIFSASILFLFPALGELYNEVGGVVNIAVDGMMLMSAMTGALIAIQTGNVWLALLVGVLSAGLLGLVHGFISISLKVSQVATGLGIWIFALGITTFLGQGSEGPVFASIPKVIGAFTPFVFLGPILVVLFWWILKRTQFGLQVRAAGHDPRVAEAWGANVTRIRYIGTIVGGLMAGLGGAYLSLSYTTIWATRMTAGRGFISLALVFFSMHKPALLGLSSLFFGFLWILSSQLQMYIPFLNVATLQAVPYLVTIVILTISTKYWTSSRMPDALGVPYLKE